MLGLIDLCRGCADLRILRQHLRSLNCGGVAMIEAPIIFALAVAFAVFSYLCIVEP